MIRLLTQSLCEVAGCLGQKALFLVRIAEQEMIEGSLGLGLGGQSPSLKSGVGLT